MSPSIYKISPMLKVIVLIVTLICPVFSASFSRVIIDAGHGDQDVGGNNGKVYEKHLALDTALRVEYLLKKKGITTTMTRRSDKFISLAKRASIGSRYKNAIFVSIHYNWTWKKGVTGLETFYYTSRGKTLANYIQSGMLSKVKTTNRGVKYGRYYVLRNTKNPAVLVECGFISNSSERSNMKKGNWRKKISEGIAKGILNYHSARKSGKVY